MATKMHTEGLEFILQVVFSEEQSVPANYYVGLCEESTVGDTDGLGDLTECAAAGYARQTIPSTAVGWVVGDFGTNEKAAVGAQATFSFSGAGNPLYSWFLATTVDDSGKLVQSASLNGAPITPAPGGSHKVTPTIQATRG
jgi:hypothetical protein